MRSEVSGDCIVRWSQGRPSRCPRICSLFLCEWRVQWLWNRVLVRCLAGIDYKMPELIFDDFIMGSRLCPWSPIVALLLNSGVEATLMCLDSLKLSNCVRTAHVGSSISAVKATKRKCFLITLHELFS
ncbi:hypothetical protein M9H77_07813 [Catharanthus roseus]|uniref:Uncharacterized protein n=1 Tax=Catharanthus roseus TaxID=4058 RepID=A0ACC0BWA3_CATRO|nr:hypothetical protein M9H77_07813 [Catharanthus roseus]